MKKESITAYYELKESGRLTRLQQKVLEIVNNHGPITGRQIDTMIKGGWKRLSELQRKGVIKNIGDSKWIATGQLPLCDNPVKRKPSAKSLQLLVDKMADGRDLSALYAKAYEQGYKDAKAGYDMPEEL